MGAGMSGPYVDLHIHSIYSDGSLTPAEIAESAHENGVALLAVADHDTIKGVSETRAACAKYDINCITATEIDSLDGNINFHILAYDFDINNEEFIDFLGHARFLLDESSVKLVELMHRDYNDISIPDYMDFTYDRRLGGWKALHYIVADFFVAIRVLLKPLIFLRELFQCGIRINHLRDRLILIRGLAKRPQPKKQYRRVLAVRFLF